MKVVDLVEKLQLKVFSGQAGLNREVTGGYVSDLLSDVMGNAAEGDVWITLQTHQNVLAIAALKEVAADILVKGREPEPEMLCWAPIWRPLPVPASCTSCLMQRDKNQPATRQASENRTDDAAV